MTAAKTLWMDDALCVQTDPEAFFPEAGGSTRAARSICARCEVSSECLEYALETGQHSGVWGDTNERDRRQPRDEKETA